MSRNLGLPRKRLNGDKPRLWKVDIAAPVNQFNARFMRFAPEAFRSNRLKTAERVKAAWRTTRDLRGIDAETFKANPGTLPTLRMCPAPPLAVDRLIGLSGVNKNLVGRMEGGKLPNTVDSAELNSQLGALCRILQTLSNWLGAHDCRKQAHPVSMPLRDVELGTYTFRMNISVGEAFKVNIPVDVVVQPEKPRKDRRPILIEAKWAGDFRNTNKRRKEEAMKAREL